jgi:hypothetical protein
MMLMSLIVSGVPQGPAKLPDDDVTRPCFCRERPTENDFGAHPTTRVACEGSGALLQWLAALLFDGTIQITLVDFALFE